MALARDPFMRDRLPTVLRLAAVLAGVHAGAAGAVAQRPSSAASGDAAAPDLGTTALIEVTVIDVVTGQLRPRQTVVVRDTRIEAIGPSGRVRVPADARVVDARGKYLIPGLWDMHAHLWIWNRFFPGIQYPSYIVNGVTGIRHLNVPCLEVARRWRQDIAEGRQIGPRQFLSGPALDSKTYPTSCGGVDPLGAGHLVVPTPARAQPIVDSLKAAGADLLKVYMPTREVYFAIAAAARQAGIPFGGHVANISLEEASDSGQRIVDHSMGLNAFCPDSTVPAAQRPATASRAACAALVQRLRRNRTWIDMEGAWPADLTWRERNARARYWPDSVFRLQDSIAQRDKDSLARQWRTLRPLRWYEQLGLPMVTGTDAGPGSIGPPGFTLADVVVSLVEWGLTPLSALQAATLNPAKALDATDSLGTVTVGKLADLVLLDGDPLADIHHLRQIRAVVANGRYYDRAALDRVLEARAQAKTRYP